MKTDRDSGNKDVNYECITYIRAFQASRGNAFALKVSENSDQISVTIDGNRADIPKDSLPNTYLDQTAWHYLNCRHFPRFRDCFVITYNGNYIV